MAGMQLHVRSLSKPFNILCSEIVLSHATFILQCRAMQNCSLPLCPSWSRMRSWCMSLRCACFNWIHKNVGNCADATTVVVGIRLWVQKLHDSGLYLVVWGIACFNLCQIVSWIWFSSQLGLGTRLYIGPSEINGWGLFVNERVEKGAFLKEYVHRYWILPLFHIFMHSFVLQLMFTGTSERPSAKMKLTVVARFMIVTIHHISSMWICTMY